MARGPAPKAKGRAAKAAGSGEKRKAPAKPTNALEKAELSAAAPAKRVKQETTDQKAEICAQKAVKDNFRSWADDDVYLHCIGGVSLFERIVQDKKAWLLGNRGAMGKCYYAGLKEMYKRRDENALEVRDEKEDEDPKLVKALHQVFSKKRNLQMLVEWLRHAPLCNQRNLVALLKTCQTMSPRYSLPYNELGIGLMEWFARHSAKVQYPAEVNAMGSYMNQCLLKTVLDYKRHGLTKTEWWANYKHIGKLVLDEASADRCFACGGNFIEVQADLASLMTSGELGQTLFGVAWNELASDKVRLIMKQCIDEFRQQKVISKIVLEATLKHLKDKASEAGCSAFEPTDSATKVLVKFMGVEVSVVATSIMDEMELLAWSHIKTVAVKGGQLSELWGEKSFGVSDPVVSGTVVVADVVEEVAKVRAMGQKFEADEGEPLTKGMLQSILKEHGNFMGLQDKRFRIERAFFDWVIDGGADHRFKDLVLASLPADGCVLTMGAARDQLEKLVESVVYRFANPSLQVAGMTILEQLKALQEKRVVTKSTAEDPFICQCRASMATWYSFQAPGEETAKTGVPGALAAFAYYEAQQAKKDKAFTYSALQVLLSFWWLLSEEQNKLVFSWADGLAGRAAAKPPPKATKAPTSSKAKTPSAKSHVASLFKKSATT